MSMPEASKTLAVLVTALLLTPARLSASAPVAVDSMDSLRETIKRATPGTVIVVADGVYELKQDLELKRLNGKPQAPITIRAESPLGVELRGDAVVKLRHSRHLILEGFRFRMKSDAHGKSGAVSVRNCRRCRITRNDFELNERDTEDKNQTWLTIDGEETHHNRIDRNRFANKTKKGHFIFITGEGSYVSQHDLIERNHFVDRAYGEDANQYEAIRVGESPIGNAGGKSHTVIRQNLFERCQGEDEMVSFKVGGGSFLENTVINCHGNVVFRAGNDGVFAGNIMLNTYTARPFTAYRAGGIRFYGRGHRVYNNYFEGLDGTSLKAPLAVMHGAPAGSGTLGVADGLPATQCEIVHNTWVRCAQLRIGHASKKRPLPPQQCRFENNIVCKTRDEQLLQLYEADGVRFRGNLLFANQSKETGVEGLGFSEQMFCVANPQLKSIQQLDRLTKNSPAIDAALGDLSYVNKDIDGLPRGKLRDIGADEYTNGPARLPLAPSEVGVTANEESSEGVDGKQE